MQLFGFLIAQRNQLDAGASTTVLLIQLAFVAICVICLWKIFEKAGEFGWKAIVPIYNMVVLLKIVGKPWYWLLLMMIPLVGIVIAILVTRDLARCFGKGVGFTIGLILLPFIFYPILAFGDAKYQGVA